MTLLAPPSWTRNPSGSGLSASACGTSPVGGQLAQRRGEAPLARENVAHREHQERADAILPGQRKHRFARVLVQHVKGDHRDIPHAVAAGALRHRVLGVAGRGLGDAEMAELALLLLAQQRRREHMERMVVSARGDAVQLVDIDVIGAELPAMSGRGSRPRSPVSNSGC